MDCTVKLPGSPFFYIPPSHLLHKFYTSPQENNIIMKKQTKEHTMKHNQKFTPIILGLLVLASLTLTACTNTAAKLSTDASAAIVTNEEAAAIQLGEPVADEAVVEAETEGESTVVLASEAQSSAVVNANGLTDAEIEGLLYMREEEKLAHDVYVTLYELWGLQLFNNIAGSELSHTNAVKNLLDIYGIADPATSAAVGVFTNPTLQSLYNELVATGAKSLADALKVGAAIEEIDILDLQQNLTGMANTNIRTVYENLLSGSENHLRAFTSTFARQTGETYAPQYLSQAVYNAIVSESIQNNALMQGNAGGRGRRP